VAKIRHVYQGCIEESGHVAYPAEAKGSVNASTNLIHIYSGLPVDTLYCMALTFSVVVATMFGDLRHTSIRPYNVGNGSSGNGYGLKAILRIIGN
jgi:hypothetical protein